MREVIVCEAPGVRVLLWAYVLGTAHSHADDHLRSSWRALLEAIEMLPSRWYT